MPRRPLMPVRADTLWAQRLGRLGSALRFVRKKEGAADAMAAYVRYGIAPDPEELEDAERGGGGVGQGQGKEEGRPNCRFLLPCS